MTTELRVHEIHHGKPS